MPRKTALTITPDMLAKPAARRVAAVLTVPVEAVVLGGIACWMGVPHAADAAVRRHFEDNPADLRGVLMSPTAPKRVPSVAEACTKPATQVDTPRVVTCVDPPPEARSKRVPGKSQAKPKPAPEHNSTASCVPAARPRNLLFDAIADVCGVDVGLRPKAVLVGKVAATLTKAAVPYTPDEVRAFGERFWELCPWAADVNRTRPTPGELEKHIDQVRAVPVSRSAPLPAARQTAAERQSSATRTLLEIVNDREQQRRDPGLAQPPAGGVGAARGPVQQSLFPPAPRPAAALPPHPHVAGAGPDDAG